MSTAAQELGFELFYSLSGKEGIIIFQRLGAERSSTAPLMPRARLGHPQSHDPDRGSSTGDSVIADCGSKEVAAEINDLWTEPIPISGRFCRTANATVVE